MSATPSLMSKRVTLQLMVATSAPPGSSTFTRSVASSSTYLLLMRPLPIVTWNRPFDAAARAPGERPTLLMSASASMAPASLSVTCISVRKRPTSKSSTLTRICILGSPPPPDFSANIPWIWPS